MHHQHRLLRILAGSALAGALAIFFVVAIAQVLGWYRFVPVLSGSMSGFVETGDVAVLQPLDAGDLAVGDVIAFQAPVGDRQLMLHRVSEIVSDAPDLRIRTRGDANPSGDPWTATVTDETLWKATDRIPKLGQPVVFARRVGAPTILMMAGGVILVALILRRLWIVEPDDADAREPVPDDTDARDATEQHDVAADENAHDSIVGIGVVALVLTVALGLLVARPAFATFTAGAAEQQRVTFRSEPIPTELSAPTSLSAGLVCDLLGQPSGVTLDWTAPVQPSDFITVERSSTPILGQPEPFVLLATVAGTEVAFTDDFATVDPPPTNPLDLRYRVRSVSTNGSTSTYSNEAQATVCGLPAL